jgi:hypothetical protein
MPPRRKYLQQSRSAANLPTALNASAPQAVNSLAGLIFVISFAVGALNLLVWGASSASAQLTFNVINQGSATPQMMTGFAQAGALWSAYLKDPTTINIRVGASPIES